MKLRKIYGQNREIVQAQRNGDWVSLCEVENLSEIAANYGVQGELDTDLLAVLALGAEGWATLEDSLVGVNASMHECTAIKPFAPASFRDFMLYEDHVINSTRGYVQKYMPAAYCLSRAYETITRSTFPAFKPKKLWYSQPIYYLSNHINIGTSGDCVVWPHYSGDLDYELELGAVLARSIRNASLDDVEKAIGGFVLLNDFSARDVQRLEMESGFGPQKCKHFFSSISNEVITADEILPRLGDLEGSVSINGKTVANCSSAGARFSIVEAISHASISENLVPGELFGTGTLPGGAGLENGFWLKRGDQIELSLDTLSLTNCVVGENK